MKKIKILSLFLIIVSFLLSCSTSDDNNSDTSEIFGAWSPSFTNQTSDFTQTRVGSQGTQENRTITVTSTSTTTESNEETENNDVNEDNDLFDDINIIETTFTSSNNLGSFSTTNYEITTDNDMVLKVGNSEYDISDGVIENFGIDDGLDECGKYDGYLQELTIYSSGGSIDSNGDLIGNGREIYFVLYSSISSSLDIGTYTFDNVDNYYDSSNTCLDVNHIFQVKTFDSGDYSINRENEDLLDFSAGTINVSINGEIYTINFEGRDTNNTNVSFFYRGNLSFVDRS